MHAVGRRDVLGAGALGISTFVLPSAAAAATGELPQSAPEPPVVGATVAGGVLSITLASAPSAGTHTVSLWRGSATATEDPAPVITSIADGVLTVSVGAGIGDDAPLSESQDHVVRVTHTTAGGSATSTLFLTARNPAATTGSGGAGAASTEIAISYPVAGFGPSAVTFILTGAGGGAGGADGDSFQGGAGGAGRTISGRLAVRSGDVLRVHAGGQGGAGGSDSNSASAAGAAGSSTLDFAYRGGAGGAPGTSGTSGGGGGGGAATVLRRSRGGFLLDVAAGGGGGGGGSGSATGFELGGRPSGGTPSTTTDGTSGTSPGGSDGGGGGGGGGGAAGGAGGGLISASEFFGEGGRQGSSSTTAGDVTVTSDADHGSVAPGSGLLSWHDVDVEHSSAVAVVPAAPVTAAGIAATPTSGSTLTLVLLAAAGDGSSELGTHTVTVWEGAEGTVDPSATPSRSETAVAAGSTTATVTGLDVTQPHVVRIRHTVGSNVAESTVTLAATTLTVADGSDGATAGSDIGATGGLGGGGSTSSTLTLPSSSGYGPTAVRLELVGGSGGKGGDDGVSGIGGAAGSGQRLRGALGVQDGDLLVLHTGGGGGDGASNTRAEGSGGRGGTSPISDQYAGGAGARTGTATSGTSGGGAGGGAATVLRRTRGAAVLDVVAAGGGGGGGSGNADRTAQLGGQAWAAAVSDTATAASSDTSGVAGTITGKGDGGGGGGGGGGVRGGGGGKLFEVGSEDFGYGGRMGLSTADSDGGEVDVTADTSGSARAGGTAVVEYHTVTVAHTV